MIDRLFDWLVTPKVARVRRWAFLVTIPLAYLVVRARGLDAGLALIAAELAIGIAVWSYLLMRPGPRREVALDLLMHPTARRLTLTEARVLTSVPRRVVRRSGRRRGSTEFACGKRNSERWFALAITPAVVAETAAIHLLLPDGWVVVRIVAIVVSIYSWWWLVSLAWGPSVMPHELRTDGRLVLRGGPLYVATSSAGAVSHIAADLRSWDRIAGLVAGPIPGEVALPVGGKTDVRIEFARPVMVERPVAGSAEVRVLHVAVDEPTYLIESVQRKQKGQDA